MRTLHSTEKHDDLQPVMAIVDQSPLRKIIQKAKFLLTLHKRIQTILPETLRTYCHVMNVNEGVVILGVSNAAIATRIQFMSTPILSELKKSREYASLLRIQCKVCAANVTF